MQRSTQHPRRRAWLRRLIVVAVLAAAVGALLSQTKSLPRPAISSRTATASPSTAPTAPTLTRCSPRRASSSRREDTYETGYADGMNQITVRRMQMVTVINRGAQSVIGTYGETVGSLLTRMGITPGAGDTLSCSSETQTYDGMTIELVHTETRIEGGRTWSSPIPSIIMEGPRSRAGRRDRPRGRAERPDPRQERGHLPQRKEVSRVVVQETVKTKPVTQLVIRGVDRTIMEQPADPEPAEQAAPAASSGTALRQLLVRLVVLRRLTL